jgi:hypothetical protein
MFENHQKLIEMSKSGGGQEKLLDDLQQSVARETQRLEVYAFSPFKSYAYLSPFSTGCRREWRA